MTYPQEHEAPAGRIWICVRCGASGKNRFALIGHCCFENAKLYWGDAAKIRDWRGLKLVDNDPAYCAMQGGEA